MAQMKKPAVSGKTVKTTTYSLLNPFKKDVKMVNERTTRKPAVKRPGAKPAPLGTPPERTRRGTPAPLGTPPAKPKGRRPAPKPKTTKKAPGKMTPQDKAMKKILEKKYGKDVYKG
jgi:hypothetical protein